MTPARGTVLVRKVEFEETLPGGKVILPDPYRDRYAANQAEIVAVGPWADCDDEDCEWRHPHTPELQAGEWVILAPRSLVATHEDDLFIAAQDAVLAIVREP